MFVAHIRNEETGQVIHQVKDHCLGTARYAKEWARDIDCPHMAELVSLLHDIGKMKLVFQKYILGESKATKGTIDHAFAGAAYISQLSKTNDAYAEVAEFLGRIIISHHGLHDCIDSDGQPVLKKRIDESHLKSEDYNEIHRNTKDTFQEENIINLLDKAAKEYRDVYLHIENLAKKGFVEKKQQRKAFSFYYGMFERTIESILIDADRTDTTDFTMNAGTEFLYENHIVWERILEKYCDFVLSLPNEKAIDSYRKDISDRCSQYAKENHKICQLIVPTGGGKTLSSFRFALEYAKRTNKSHIYYVAPYNSILSQNSDIYRNIVGEDYFLEHHSDVLINDKDQEVYDIHTEKWDVPVIATTMVQFFDTLFSDRTSAVRRMHRLLNSVIIIDEMQSVPRKCIHMFNLAMNYLSYLGQSVVVLCTATQPSLDVRKEKLGIKYPVLLDSEKSMTGEVIGDFARFERTQIILEKDISGITNEEAAKYCYEKYQLEGNTLFICNTKKAVADIYLRLKRMVDENVVLMHLSTNMCPEHKRDMIRKMRQYLCKESSQKVICITTALIEAGVDISFDCVIRSLAGVDNIAQAAGRCNRNGEKSQLGKVFIVKLKDENLLHLDYIKENQDATIAILNHNKVDELLLPKTIDSYYTKLFANTSHELSYRIDYNGRTDNILNLLSICEDHMAKGVKPYQRQKSKTAGTYFELIDNKTVDVMVPYNDEAKSIITLLNSDISPLEEKKLLRKSQKYMVSLWNYQRQKLEQMGGIAYGGEGRYAFLTEKYYDDEMGVTMEGGEYEVLLF